MGFWETLLQIIPLVWLWETFSQHLGYIKDLKYNLDTLMTETNALKRKRDEFEENVRDAESVGKKRLRFVDDWLNEVDKFVPGVDSLKLEFDEGSMNPFSRHKFGKRVAEKMEDVKKLLGEGNFNEVATSPRRAPAQEVPEQLQQQSTSEETLEKISEALNKEEIGTLCVYGMGGIGKTTLMKAIYNKFIEGGDFHQVIWVTVSKDLNLEVIQQKIGSKLRLEFLENESIEEKRDRLYGRLCNVRYLLILDDLWQELPLDRVGIPRPTKKNGSKIAITTRLIAVSSVMKTDKEIKVKVLSSEEAWDLFYSHTGDVVRQPEIQPLAKEVVEECAGLPLAIKTVGGALRRKGRKELWQNALRALRESEVPEILGMQHEVFLPLKLSYDYLEDSKIQLCFLYCCLYPEDHKISIKGLLRFWAFEGLIDNVNSLDEALKKGHSILERLKDACLLEEGNQYVTMHDLLRDLAVWITSPLSCFQAPKFLVKAGEGLKQPPKEEMWKGVGRISLIHNEISELQMIPNCPDLVSLFLGGNYLQQTIHSEFFRLMPKLHILDLSNTGINSLPSSLYLLVNLHVLVLRSCKKLLEIPLLGELKELRLLDLHGTPIKNWPKGIESLSKLRLLDLSYSEVLSKIPCNTISGLTCLEDLRLLGIRGMVSVEIWREIATLPNLTHLKIQLPRSDAFTANDMQHPMWSRLSIFRVHFGFPHDTPMSSRLSKFRVHFEFSHDADRRHSRSGRTACIYYSQYFPSQIKSLIGNVEHLLVKGCQGLESVSQITGDSTTLISIKFNEVQSMKCGVDWREMGENNALANLQVLVLQALPSLKKVFDGGPPKGFQQLKKIFIYNCPKLRCIFSSTMSQHIDQLKVIEVEDCEEIEEIIEGGLLPDEVQHRLSEMHLWNLPKLKRICSQHLILTSICRINMAYCPELRRFPVLGSHIQKISGRISGVREWWEGIEWDEHSKSICSTIYIEEKR